MALGTPPTSPSNPFFGLETFKGGSLFGSNEDDIESPLEQRSKRLKAAKTLASATSLETALSGSYPWQVTDDDAGESDTSVRDTIVVKHSLFVSDEDQKSDASGLLDELGNGNDCYGDVTSDEGLPSQRGALKYTTKLSTTEKTPAQGRFLDKLSISLPSDELLVPRSSFEPFDPPAAVVSEAKALKLLGESRNQPQEEFTEYTLSQFVIYCDKSKTFDKEMRSLHCVRTTTLSGPLYFDGVVSRGRRRFFVSHVQIKAMPIDNYIDLGLHTVEGNIWLQTDCSAARNGFYRLDKPAPEYERFFKPFAWLADLTKHFVDFIDRRHDRKMPVTIHDFQQEFSNWLARIHGSSDEFQAWRSQYPRDDFRTAVVANTPFLYKEACGVLPIEEVHFHTIWSEIKFFDRHKRIRTTDKDDATIVTDYVYDCFRQLPCGKVMKVAHMKTDTELQHAQLVEERGMEKSKGIKNTERHRPTSIRLDVTTIKKGDTISTTRDDNDQAVWKHQAPRDCPDADRWFARVEKVNIDNEGKRSFDVIWYYRPSDTLCGIMKYPWDNELFFSTHCSCSEKHKITEDEVLGIHEVEFWGTSETAKEFFCRQTYIHEDRKWITLKEDHLICVHKRKRSSRPDYQIGDTLLVQKTARSPQCDPCELIGLDEDEFGVVKFSFHRLLRRSDVESSDVPVNEVVYTEEIFNAPESRIIGRCGIKHFAPGQVVTAPFDRDGVGCLFYFTYKLVDRGYGQDIVPLPRCPASLRQYQDLQSSTLPKLRGLDLFCGGGNFGRGLEDGGAVEVKWANDFNDIALHTYMANCPREGSVDPFLGSIDELNKRAIRGKFGKGIPQIGDVEFIAGGSPCPGFSNLTNDLTTDKQRKNQSLVAAFATSVDIHRPKFGLLENVPGIIQPQVSRDEDVFSQLVCCLVGMGYQTRLFFLDAASCGASQMRSRVFVVFAAPGYVLPSRPQQSHALPSSTNRRAVGRLPTGERMAEREFAKACPFDTITAQMATSDLTHIGDAKPDICVQFPDHRTSMNRTRLMTERIALIPKRPFGMNFTAACYGTKDKPASLSSTEKAKFLGTGKNMATSKRSNAFGRIRPDRLFETIVTAVSPLDAKSGRVLHWNDDRIITVMEARRAQGFRDEDVILGSPSQQYRIVGNSVAREVAVALGICFQEAYQAGWRAPKPRQEESKIPMRHKKPGTGRTVPKDKMGESSTSMQSSQQERRTNSKRKFAESGSPRPQKSPRQQLSDRSSGSSSSSSQRASARRSQKAHSLKVLQVDSDDSS